MALPIKLPFGTRTYTADITDVSTESSAYVPVAGRGKVVGVYTVLQGTVTGTSILTFKINGTAMTGGTIADVGTTAAYVASCAPYAANLVNAGQYLEAATNGGSTNTVRLTVTFVVREF
jgi:hypothetical protein